MCAVQPSIKKNPLFQNSDQTNPKSLIFYSSEVWFHLPSLPIIVAGWFFSFSDVSSSFLLIVSKKGKKKKGICLTLPPLSLSFRSEQLQLVGKQIRMEIDKAVRECSDRRLQTKYKNAVYVIERSFALYSYDLLKILWKLWKNRVFIFLFRLYLLLMNWIGSLGLIPPPPLSQNLS